ncbi:MAG: hypothetical protein ACFE7R_07140, partial [Candidatus Hodarchaeota archaeon]
FYDDGIISQDNLELTVNALEWVTAGRLYNQILGVLQCPLTVTSDDSVDISCDVTDFVGLDVVTLYFRVDGGSWQPIVTDLISGITYRGTIPAQASGLFVEYYITSANVLGQMSVDDNEGEYYSYTVIADTTTTTSTTVYFRFLIKLFKYFLKQSY